LVFLSPIFKGKSGIDDERIVYFFLLI